MNDDLINRIECAIRHIQTAVDVDPWAVEIAVEAMERMASANLQPNLQPTCNLASNDCISREAAIDAMKSISDSICEQQAIDALCELPSAQSEIVRCKDCENWIPGYITDNDDFIPPKCGKYQQMVGHSSDDYCSLAERRTE